ncbi:MAG: hypothetical protein AAFR96_10400 [Planctomycetota bacterium]
MVPAPWSIDEIADHAAAGIADANQALRDENAVRGLDHLDEIDLHTVLEAGFVSADLGLAREHPFPTPAKRKPKASERERCDLVLLPGPDAVLIDPVEADAEAEALAQTLFATAAADALAPGSGSKIASPGVRPDDAFWIEVKSTGQFVARDDVPQPNSRYTTELIRHPAQDIRKLVREPMASQAAAAVLLFAADEATARHDLSAAVHAWLDSDLPIRSPAIRVAPIDDRIGNTVCAVCLVPIRKHAGS